MRLCIIRRLSRFSVFQSVERVARGNCTTSHFVISQCLCSVGIPVNSIMSAGGPKKGGKSAQDNARGARFGRVKSNLKMGIVGLPNVGGEQR